MDEIIIVGAGGCGREVANWIEDINKVKETWNILGFLDDNLTALDGIPCKYKIIGRIADHQPAKNVYYAMGIANPAIKKTVGSKLLKAGSSYAQQHSQEWPG